jgi:hypothetical protein
MCNSMGTLDAKIFVIFGLELDTVSLRLFSHSCCDMRLVQIRKFRRSGLVPDLHQPHITTRVREQSQRYRIEL